MDVYVGIKVCSIDDNDPMNRLLMRYIAGTKEIRIGTLSMQAGVCVKNGVAVKLKARPLIHQAAIVAQIEYKLETRLVLSMQCNKRS